LELFKTVLSNPNPMKASLLLQRNGIMDDGAVKIAEIIANISSPRRKSHNFLALSELVLDDNPIGKRGALAIAKTIMAGAKIKVFSYFGLSGDDHPPRSSDMAIATLSQHEIDVYSGLYQRHHEVYLTSGCGHACPWPSCRLLWAAKLTKFSSSLKECRALSAVMQSSWAVSLGPHSQTLDTSVGLNGFLSFLADHPVGILARAVYQRDTGIVRKDDAELAPAIFFPKWKEVTSKVPSEKCLTDDMRVRPWKRAYYFRVPKTASTSAMAVIEADACLTKHVEIRDHGDGCINLWKCNGTCLPVLPALTAETNPWAYASFPTSPQIARIRSVAVLREPCERFLSSVSHLQGMVQVYVLPSQTSRLVSWHDTVESLLMILRDRDPTTSRGCANSTDPSCLVRIINAQTAILGSHRVIIYPQAFFMHPHTDIVCSGGKSSDVIKPLYTLLAQATGCDEGNMVDVALNHSNKKPHPSLLSTAQRTEIRELYRPDVLLWNRHCANY
jgi:hypothetical protein